MRNQRILGHFLESAELKKQAAEVLADPIGNAADLMFSVLTQGNKILACGNGGSAADCQHFAAELVGRIRKGASTLPAMGIDDRFVNYDRGSAMITVSGMCSRNRFRLLASPVICCWPFQLPEIPPMSWMQSRPLTTGK